MKKKIPKLKSKMDIETRLMGRCGHIEKDAIKADIGLLFRNLLLFDVYILDSVRLQEFPHLLRVLGYEQTLELINYQALKIRCDALTIGSVGQTAVLGRNKDNLLPLGSYAFATVQTANRREYISKCLKNLEGIPRVSFKETKNLKKAIATNLISIDQNIGHISLGQMKSDLAQNVPVIRKALEIQLRQEYGIDAIPYDLQLKVHQDSESRFETETNLEAIFGFDREKIHRSVESALLAVGRLNLRIAEMKGFSALSGFKIDELPIFESKLDSLRERLPPDIKDSQFRRVVKITGGPSFDAIGSECKIDLEKFFKIRESGECKEFRKWLSEASNFSDKKLSDRFASIRSKIGSAIGGNVGKAIRLLVPIGVGIIDGGMVSGPVIGVIDLFILEKIFPCSGPVAFINRLYPSIFEKVHKSKA